MLRTTEQAIQKFRRYVIDCHRTRRKEWERARALVQEVADAILLELEINEGPVDVQEVAEALGVHVRLVPRRSVGSHGYLISKDGSFEATIFDYGAPTSGPSEQARFTIAHECGHTFFFENAHLRRERVIPRGSDGAGREEGLCDDFARAVLFPTRAVLILAKESPDVRRLAKFARTFAGPMGAAARRVLYDFGAWERSVILRVSRRTRTPRVAVYRGRGRRETRDAAPSADALETALQNVGRNLQGAIQALLRVSSDSIYRSGSTYWVMVGATDGPMRVTEQISLFDDPASGGRRKKMPSREGGGHHAAS